MNKQLFGLITLRLNIYGYNRYARLKLKRKLYCVDGEKYVGITECLQCVPFVIFTTVIFATVRDKAKLE